MPAGFTIEELERAIQQRQGISLPDLPELPGSAMGPSQLAPIDDASGIFLAAQAKKQSEGLRNPFILLLDIIGSPGFAVAGGVRGLIGDKASAEQALGNFFGGLTVAFTGDPEHRHSFTEVLGDLGWEPETTAGHVARGAVGLALDVALDPLTYVGIGLARHGRKIGTIRGLKGSLKEGAEAVAKDWGTAQGMTLTRRGAKIAERHFLRWRRMRAPDMDPQKVVALFDELITPLATGPLGRTAEALIKREGLEKFLRTKGIGREFLEDLAKVLGKGTDDEALGKLAAWGYARWADKGGIKLFGRTLIRSHTADRVGAAYDAILSKYVVDPVTRGVVGLAKGVGKVPGVGTTAKVLGKGFEGLKTGIRKTLGTMFNYELLTDELVYRDIYRRYTRAKSVIDDDVARVIRDNLQIVTDPDTGSARRITIKESRLVHEALHNANFYRATEGETPARMALEALPEHLRPVATKVRTLLDEVADEELRHGILEEVRQMYMPQMWEPEAWQRIKSLPPERQPALGYVDWFSKRQEVQLPFKKAVKQGLVDDLWGVLYKRIRSGRRIIKLQGFAQEIAEQYGSRLIRLAKDDPALVLREGPFRWILDDYVRALEDVPLDAAGKPVTQSQHIRRALELLEDPRGRYDDALRALRKARPIMPEASVDELMGRFHQRLDQDIKGLRNAMETRADTIARKADPYYEVQLPHKIRTLQDHKRRVDEVGELLKTRSLERVLERHMAEAPAARASLWAGNQAELRHAMGIVKQGRRRLLEEEIELLKEQLLEAPIRRRFETRWGERHLPIPEAAMEGGVGFGAPHRRLLDKIAAREKELEEVLRASLAAPSARRRRGIPGIRPSRIRRFSEDMRKLGIPEPRIAETEAALREFDSTVRGTSRQYREAAGSYHRWKLGQVSSDDPTQKALLNRKFDQMEAISRNVEEAEKALTGVEGELEDATARLAEEVAENGRASFSTASEVTLLWKRTQVMRQGVNYMKEDILTPEQIRAAKELFNSPEAAARRALQNPGPVAENISSETGEIISLPITRDQIDEIARVLHRQGLGEHTPELLERVTGKRDLAHLSFEEAREFLEIARRRPARFEDMIRAPRYGTLPDAPTTMPELHAIRVRFEGRWVKPKDIILPGHIAETMKKMLKESTPHPLIAGWVRAYDALHDLFRWSVTMPWIAFHARNSMDASIRGIAEVGLTAFDPYYVKEFVRTLTGSTRPIRLKWGGEIPREALKLALAKRGLWRKHPIWSELPFGAPQKIYRDTVGQLQGVLRGTPQAEGYMTLRAYKLADRFQTGPGKYVRGYLNWSKEIENAAIFNFMLHRLNRGEPWEKAMDAAEDVFFTFFQRTNIEKQWLRRMFPFYNFLRSAVPYTVHVAKEHPWFLTSLSHARQFAGEREELEPYLPRFVKDSFSIKWPTGRGRPPQFLVFNNFVTVDWARDWAMSDTNAFLRAGLGQLSPFLTAPIEMASGKDLYFGSDIKGRKLLRRPTDGPAKWIDQFTGWLNMRDVVVGGKRYTAVDAQRLWLLRTFMLGRVYSTLDAIGRRDLVAGEKLLRIGAGVISTRIDLERQQTLLMDRAQALQSRFRRAIRIGDDVEARRILQELRE